MQNGVKVGMFLSFFLNMSGMRRFYNDNGMRVTLAQALRLALEFSQFPCLYGNLGEPISIMIWPH